jgi:hypothetical protein
MLATAKPHERLGLRQWEYNALKQVRDDLATGRISTKQFNMDVVSSNCGTVHCIGGHMARISGMEGFQIYEYAHNRNRRRSKVLKPLFFPKHGRHYNATPAQAVKVIDHFLLTGEVDWELATTAGPLSQTPRDRE